MVKTNYFPVSSKEDIKINTYKLPVTWGVYATVEIEATSIEEAVKIFKETEDEMLLPTTSDYVDGSFRLAVEDINVIENIN